MLTYGAPRSFIRFSVDNILFNLPLDEERYQKTLEVRSDITRQLYFCLRLLQVCALVSDLEILEDGDDSEIGERGVRANIQYSISLCRCP